MISAIMTMVRAIVLSVVIAFASGFFTHTYSQTKPMTNVEIEILTSVGNLTVRLYDETPLHRDNFVKLVNDSFYNGVLFHRVINQFMVQSGDPDSRTAKPGTMLGSGTPGYDIEAEFRTPQLFHKRGALAAAREGDMTNPQKRSCGSQFYIVTGKVLNPGQLRSFERNRNLQIEQDIKNELMSQNRDTIMALRKARDFAALQEIQDEIVTKADEMLVDRKFSFTPEQVEAYSTIGGTPFLDGEYTVFGEVISGMEVVEIIEKSATDGNDRPIEDIRILGMNIVNHK